MELHNITCPIWGDTVPPIGRFLDEKNLAVMRSPRTGGDYRIGVEAYNEVSTLDETGKAKLTTILIDLRREGDHARDLCL